jgi:hypothetical protein
MMRHFIPFLLLVCFVACMAQGSAEPQVARPSPARVPEPDSTIAIRFAPPQGFTRVPVEAKSFGAYLRGLPLKPEGAQVHLFDGSLKRWQGAQAAVIDMSVGKRDLQQCADAIMRLRAEHLFAQDRKPEIAFHFTSGFHAPFAQWMEGERIRVNGNRCSWAATGVRGATHDDLLNYLQVVFTYASTRSIGKDLLDAIPWRMRPVDLRTNAGIPETPPEEVPVWRAPVIAGDVFVQAAHPGHAVIVVDVAENRAGEQIFLLAQSYMPAQEIHVLKNLEDAALSPWFKLNDGDELVTPEWTFRWEQRKRW